MIWVAAGLVAVAYITVAVAFILKRRLTTEQLVLTLLTASLVSASGSVLAFMSRYYQ